MNAKKTSIIFRCLIATVWLANGLFCKVLHLVPRHEMIVARILGAQHAGLLTKAIGFSEIGMAIWILSGVKSRTCAITQILLVIAMNAIEFSLSPDLLLFGKFNALLAGLFVSLIFWVEFILRKKAVMPAHP